METGLAYGPLWAHLRCRDQRRPCRPIERVLTYASSAIVDPSTSSYSLYMHLHSQFQKYRKQFTLVLNRAPPVGTQLFPNSRFTTSSNTLRPPNPHSRLHTHWATYEPEVPPREARLGYLVLAHYDERLSVRNPLDWGGGKWQAHWIHHQQGSTHQENRP